MALDDKIVIGDAMKNKKGFTLIELLAVIVLIGLLSLIIVPSILNLVNRNETKISSTTEKLIFSTVDAFLDANQTKYKRITNAVYCPTIRNLIDNGFLDENLTDIETGEKFSPELIIKSIYNGYKYEYEIVSNSSGCTENIPVEVPGGDGSDTLTSSIAIGNFNYYCGSIADDKVMTEVYKNLDAIITVPITFPEEFDENTLMVNIRRGAGYVTNFTVEKTNISSTSITLKITVPTSAKNGEYVIEITGDGIDKVTSNFTVSSLSDNNANEPDLLNDSLTPVVYDEDEEAWVIADPDNGWYNYASRKWANAVILNSGVSNAVGTVLNVETQTKAMYVWIPRYEYKIEGNYGKHSNGTVGTSETPGQIQVHFVSPSQINPSCSYHLSSAFWWDNNSNGIRETGEELAGIWVGKFETTGSYTNPTILPNKEALSNGVVYSQYISTQKFANYLTDSSNVDSHMAKNSEWLAAAYLSQSKYGKYGNPYYTGVNKEVYQNNSYSYTGRSMGGPAKDSSSYSSAGTCQYNNMTSSSGVGYCGGGASTTGDVYGIYDMVGGYSEYVMAYYTGANSNYTSNPNSYFGWNSSSNSSGFTSKPDDKYFDKYTTNNLSTACNGEFCYGHGKEVLGWYGDTGVGSISAAQPWMSRGGFYNSDGRYGGIFAAVQYTGGDTGTTANAFRAVLISTGA